MKTNRLFLGLAASLLACATTLSAQNLTTFGAVPGGSKMKLDGTSTVHDWTIESSLIGGTLEIDGAFLADPTKAKPGKVSAKALAVVPVRSLKSGKESMDAVMQDAMKQDKHPRIEYRLSELTLKETPKSAEGPFNFDSVGELVISGATNKVSFPVTMQRVEQNKLKTVGSTSIKMTAYKITPPAPKIALGLITTGDDVKISFDWVTVQK